MSTKNDKTPQQLEHIKDLLLKQFTLDELKQFYNSHSTRELESYFREHYNISCYYAEKIFVNILGFEKKTHKSSKTYWLEHMRATHEKKYGGIGFAVKDLAKKSHDTNLNRNGSEYYSNRTKASETKLIKYGDANYNNIEKAISTSKERYGGVGFQSPELNKKSKDTNLARHGSSTYSNTEKQVATCRARWGYDNYNNRTKTQETCFERYGVRSYSQTSDFSHQRRKRYKFNDVSFDSSWELYLWIYCVDHDISIETAKVSFEYIVGEKIYTYHPDFVINNTLVEVKGDHFFENGKLVNPYDRTQDNHYNEKYNCALEHNVLIVKFEDLCDVFNYIDKTYGKNYFRKFVIHQEEN